MLAGLAKETRSGESNKYSGKSIGNTVLVYFNEKRNFDLIKFGIFLTCNA